MSKRPHNVNRRYSFDLFQRRIGMPEMGHVCAFRMLAATMSIRIHHDLGALDREIWVKAVFVDSVGVWRHSFRFIKRNTWVEGPKGSPRPCSSRKHGSHMLLRP
jgi:hypothetical protein